MSNEPEQIVRCPNCGAERPAGILSCAKCGFGNTARFRMCVACKKNISQTATFCPHCGSAQSKTSLGWWVAGFVVLGMPLGCLGGCGLLTAGFSPHPTGILLSLAGLGVGVYFLYKMIQAAKK